jgi:hypothetical protein
MCLLPIPSEEPVVSRRSILTGATALGALAPLAVMLDAVAEDAPPAGADGGVPETLAATRRGLASGERVAEAAFPLTHLGLAWTGPAAAVRLRTPAGWGPWQEPHGCPAGSDGAPLRSAVVGAAGAVGYELRVAGGGTATVLELNTVDGPRSATATAPAGRLPVPGSPDLSRVPVPVYLSRPGWGADESHRFRPDGTLIAPPVFVPVQTLTVHHTGFDDDQPDPAATIRAIYFDQAVNKDWGDVGYHLFVDDAGRVYEGTFSDPDPVPVFGPDLGADGRPQMVNGAHVGGFNAGNIGVVLIGDFTNRMPTEAARRSLTVVLALLSAVCRLDPVGTTRYVNPISGAAAELDTISGHRDWHAANPAAGATECPGNTFYPTLPRIREDAAALLRLVGRDDG